MSDSDGIVDLECDGVGPQSRRRLLSNGYEPLPILGKAPLWPKWSSEPVTVELLDRIEADPRYANHTNTGVRTGRLAVVDIDVRNPSHAAVVAEAVASILGHTEVERIGSKGKALCYHNPDPISKLTVGGIAPGDDEATTLVELLGAGQQMAAYGIHPVTGKPYDWPNAVFDSDLLGTPLTNLPPVTPDLLRQAAKMAAATLSELGYREVVTRGLDGSRPVMSVRSGEPVSVSWLVSALRSIPPSVSRGDWLRILWAVKDANLDPHLDDEERITLLDRWSSGELGEDDAHV
jgi:hypothetical protein